MAELQVSKVRRLAGLAEGIGSGIRYQREAFVQVTVNQDSSG
jgi:hypothetical protein